MTERFSIDSNVLIYAHDRSAGDKHERALVVVDGAVECDCILTVQALAEFFHVVTRKQISAKADAAAQVHDWMTLFHVVPASPTALEVATARSVAGSFSFWDAMLLETAKEAGCTVILSEDMQDGGASAGITVRNPFLGPALPLVISQLLQLPGISR